MSGKHPEKKHGAKKTVKREPAQEERGHIQKFFLVTVVVCVLPALLGLRVWSRMPPRALLTEDLEVSGTTLCFAAPFLTALLQSAAYLLSRRGRYANHAAEQLRQTAAAWVLPAFSAVFLNHAILRAADVPVPVWFWLLHLAGGILLGVGFYRPDSVRNPSGGRHKNRRPAAGGFYAAGLVLLLGALLSVPVP